MQYFILGKSNFFCQGDDATTLLEHISIPLKISEFSIFKRLCTKQPRIIVIHIHKEVDLFCFVLLQMVASP